MGELIDTPQSADPPGRFPDRIASHNPSSITDRLGYHGISRIVPGTAPPELGMEGRFNLTFRQY